LVTVTEQVPVPLFMVRVAVVPVELVTEQAPEPVNDKAPVPLPPLTPTVKVPPYGWAEDGMPVTDRVAWETSAAWNVAMAPDQTVLALMVPLAKAVVAAPGARLCRG